MPDIIAKNSSITAFSNPVEYIYANWNRAYQYDMRNFVDCGENWRFYWAKNPESGLGQWPIEAVAQMIQQGRSLITYNFCKPTVDGIAGGIMQIPFDPDYIPISDEITSLTNAIKKRMYSDKELMNWKSSFLEWIVHGLIFRGDMKIVVSDKYDELGNIGFEICLPRAVIYDPFWKSFSSSDCKKCWKESWLSAKDLIELYPERKDRLTYELFKLKKDGDSYGKDTGIVPFDQKQDVWGSLHRVIEEYEIVIEKKKSDWLITLDGDVQIPEFKKDEDRIRWLNNAHDFNWDFNRIYQKEEKRKICKVRTICRTLISDKLIEDNNAQAQIGRLPFFPWAASHLNGEWHSIIDQIKDPQISLNYGEAMIQHKLQTEGGGGAMFTDPSMFKDTETYIKFTRHRNKATSNFPLKPGFLDKGIVPALPVVKSPFPAEVYENINHIIEKIWPNIAYRTPASVGRPEPGNQTSGRLYELMKISADTLVYTLHFGLRQSFNEVYEAHLMLASEIYSNQMLPRPFNYNNEKIILNEPIEFEDGTQGIKNDVSKLKEMRHKVIISETQESPTEKMNNIGILAEFMGRVPPEAIATRALLANEISQNITQLSKESKDKLVKIGQLELEVAQASLRAQLANLTLQAQNINKMLAGEGGAPAEESPQLPPPEEISKIETAQAPSFESFAKPKPQTIQSVSEGVL